jgi:hypothetical protein
MPRFIYRTNSRYTSTFSFLRGLCWWIYSFLCSVCRSLFVLFCPLILAIVLSVLRLNASDNPRWYLQHFIAYPHMSILCTVGDSHTHVLLQHVHPVYCCVQSHTHMSYPHMSILCTAGDSHTHMSDPHMSILCTAVDSHTDMSYPHMSILCTAVYSHTHMSYLHMSILCIAGDSHTYMSSCQVFLHLSIEQLDILQI